MAKRHPSPEHADTLSLNALRGLVTDLLGRSQKAEGRLAKLEVETIQLREANAVLGLENGPLKVENQVLRDEIARLKNLPPRSPFRSSGMDKATDIALDVKPARKKTPRGAKLDVKRVTGKRRCGSMHRPAHASRDTEASTFATWCSRRSSSITVANAG